MNSPNSTLATELGELTHQADKSGELGELDNQKKKGVLMATNTWGTIDHLVQVMNERYRSLLVGE